MSNLLVTDGVSVSTRGDADIVDVTADVSAVIARHSLDEGHVLVFVSGSTAALTTVEFEPGLCRDLAAFFERISPRDMHYFHHDTWNDGNGHSHVRASLLGPSLMIPVHEGKMLLGTWQQIILIDFDNRPRDRELVVQLSGRAG